MDGDGNDLVITSPDTAGRNSLWKVHVTNPEVTKKGVVLISICSKTSVGVSFVDFFGVKEQQQYRDAGSSGALGELRKQECDRR